MNSVSVSQFTRKPGPGQFSIERLYSSVRRGLPEDVEVTLVTNRFRSSGFFKRLYDIMRAAIKSSRINHVLGDIHYVAMFFRRSGTIITVHDCILLEIETGLKRFLIWLIWYHLPLQRAEVVVVVSEFSKNSLLKWVNIQSEKIIVIPPPVGPEFKFQQKVRRPSDPWHVLMIGGAPNKNIGRSALALKGLPIKLTLIGEISEKDEKSLHNNDIDYSIFNNKNSAEILKFYIDSDILLFPSTYEGFGMPIIEAQVTGRPVITSNIGPMPCTAGDGAYFIDPFDADSIRDGILNVISQKSLYDRLVKLGLKNAARYNYKIIANEYAKLYKSL